MLYLLDIENTENKQINDKINWNPGNCILSIYKEQVFIQWL